MIDPRTPIAIVLRTLSASAQKGPKVAVQLTEADRSSTPLLGELCAALDALPEGDLLPDDGMGRWDRIDKVHLTDADHVHLANLLEQIGEMELEAHPKLRRLASNIRAGNAVSVMRYWIAADGRTPLKRALDSAEPVVSVSIGRARRIEQAAVREVMALIGHGARILAQGSDVLILTIFRNNVGIQMFFGPHFDWKCHADLIRFSGGEPPSIHDLENSVEAWWLLSDEERGAATMIPLDSEESVARCAEQVLRTLLRLAPHHLDGDLTAFKQARENRCISYLTSEDPCEPSPT